MLDFKVQRETVAKPLIKQVELAKADMLLNKEPEVDIKVMRGGVDVDITTFPEFVRFVNKIKFKIGRLLNKARTANEDWTFCLIVLYADNCVFD